MHVGCDKCDIMEFRVSFMQIKYGIMFLGYVRDMVLKVSTIGTSIYLRP